MRDKFVEYMEDKEFLVIYGSHDDVSDLPSTGEVIIEETTYNTGISETHSKSLHEGEYRGKKILVDNSLIKYMHTFEELNDKGKRALSRHRRLHPDEDFQGEYDKRYWDDIIDPAFKRKLLDNTTELTIIDPVFNRPAHAEEGGLFTTIYDYITEVENYWTYEGSRTI